MPASSLESMVSTLFTAPAAAVVDAEAAYRQIWIEWLRVLTEMMKQSPNLNLGEHLKLAPVMKLNGYIELGLTMRVAAVSERKGSAGITLGLGPIGISGAFGFMNARTEESVMQVRAQYTMSNEEVSLQKYLGNWGLQLAAPADVAKAIEHLGKLDSITLPAKSSSNG